MHLANRGIWYLSQITDPNRTNWHTQYWLSADDLHIPWAATHCWANYIRALQESHIRLTQQEDQLIWAISPKGYYTPKLGYLTLYQNKEPHEKLGWWTYIWKLKATHKYRLLFWCILQNCIPTMDYLHRRGLIGPSRCCFCHNHWEETTHIFLDCPIIQRI